MPDDLVLTPTAAANTPNWSSENNVLIEGDGLWAVNDGNANDWFIIGPFDDFPALEGSIATGFEVYLKPWHTDASGSPTATVPDVFYRLRVAISKDGGVTKCPTPIVITCDGNDQIIGDLDDLWGLDTVEFDDFSNFRVCIQRPTDLVDEAPQALARSLEYVYAKGRFVPPNVVILSSEGDCDGNVDVTWSG